MANVVLQVEGLDKKYVLNHKTIAVLKRIELTVQSGQWIMLTGQSGCGKTTFLRLLGSLDVPDSGTIKCFGESITKMTGKEKARLRRQKIGFVFQSYQLFPELDALENVMLPGRLNNGNLKARRDRAESLLDSVGMLDRLHHRPAELSGGEQQRIAIARAIMNDPDIILADEPTGNLDDVNTLEIMKILRRFQGEGMKTIVMATHDTSLSHYADKTYSFHEGHLCLDPARKGIADRVGSA